MRDGYHILLVLFYVLQITGCKGGRVDSSISRDNGFTSDDDDSDNGSLRIYDDNAYRYNDINIEETDDEFTDQNGLIFQWRTIFFNGDGRCGCYSDKPGGCGFYQPILSRTIRGDVSQAINNKLLLSQINENDRCFPMTFDLFAFSGEDLVQTLSLTKVSSHERLVYSRFSSDLTGDGESEIILNDCGSFSMNEKSRLQIYDGDNGKVLKEWTADGDWSNFEMSYLLVGGQFISDGEVTGDGIADILFSIVERIESYDEEILGKGPVYILISGSDFSEVHKFYEFSEVRNLEEFYELKRFKDWLSIGGDVTGDSQNDILIATNDSIVLFDGASYKKIHSWNWQEGIGASLGGDFDGDGKSEIMLNWRDGFAIYSSKNYKPIFTVEESILVTASFGRDATGDGIPDIIVGLPNKNDGAGEVRLISGKDFGIVRTFQPSDGEKEFGRYVEIGSDLTGDGKSEMLITSIGEEGTGLLKKIYEHTYLYTYIPDK